jgi:putative N-acetylmannosamine-6-phosphate epimerase
MDCGAICRSTKMIALKVTQRRRGIDCINFIKDHVNPGTHIMTDCWRGYSQLCNNDYVHDTVNHKLHFVYPEDPLIHTQAIERLWEDFKST